MSKAGGNDNGLPLVVRFENEWPRVAALCGHMAQRFSELQPFRQFSVDELTAFLLLETVVKIGAHLCDSGYAKDFDPTRGAVYASHLSINFDTLSVDLAASAFENGIDLLIYHDRVPFPA